MRQRHFGLLALAAIGGFFPLSATAGTTATPAGPVEIGGQIKFQGVGLNNADLGTDDGGSTGFLGGEAKLHVTATLSENTLFYWEGRGVAGVGHSSFETSDTGNVARENNFLEWRESYLQFNNIDGKGVGAKLGRQRFRETYGDWWNQNFDAIRASYDSTLFSGFLAGGENLFQYNTGRDFNEDDREIARIFGEGSWQYHYDQFFQVRAMYEDDHSGIDGVGEIHEFDDRNNAEGHLFWAGVRAAGKTNAFASGPDKIQYRFDLMGVTGNQDEDITTSAGGSNVLVTGTDSHDVLGWAFDGGVDIPLAIAETKPLLHVGYAYGSGDDDPTSGTDNAFRQNELASNSSRIGALSRNSYNYGTVLRPELSNIHIFTLGLTAAIFKASDAGLIYHYYRLAESANSLSTSGVNNTLNNNDRDLGHGVDLLFNTNLYENTNGNTYGVKEVYLRSSLGAFRAGEAYGNNEGEIAARGLVEVGFNF